MAERSRRFREGDQVIYVGHQDDFGPVFGKLYVWAHYHDDSRFSGAIKPVNGSSTRLWVMEKDVVRVDQYDDWRVRTAQRLIEEAVAEISAKYGVSIHTSATSIQPTRRA